MTTASAELLACPFCGGEATLIERPQDSLVTCSTDRCPATIDDWAWMDMPPDAAVAAWNTRAALTRAVQPAADDALEQARTDGLSWCRLAHDWMRAHDQLLGWVQNNSTVMRLFLTEQPKIDLPTVRDEGSDGNDRGIVTIVSQWREIVHAAYHMLDDQEESQQDPQLLAAVTAYCEAGPIHEILQQDADALTRAVQPADDTGAVEWQCSECQCRTYARMDERSTDDGFTTFRPGPYVRCVNCKREHYFPALAAHPAPAADAEVVEHLAAKLAAVDLNGWRGLTRLEQKRYRDYAMTVIATLRATPPVAAAVAAEREACAKVAEAKSDELLTFRDTLKRPHPKSATYERAATEARSIAATIRARSAAPGGQ
jgi:hypothetical protein